MMSLFVLGDSKPFDLGTKVGWIGDVSLRSQADMVLAKIL